MATTRGLKYLIFQFSGKVKRLREELADTIARKKGAESQLRDLKNNKKKPAKKGVTGGEAPNKWGLGRSRG